MKTIEMTTASKSLSEYVGEIGEGVLVLTVNQEPVAAIVSLKSVDREALSPSTTPEFMEIIEKARDEFKRGRKISLEAMKREV